MKHANTLKQNLEQQRRSDAKTSQEVEQITCTPEHPFFVQGQGFTLAGRLAIGNAIVTRAGPDLIVKSVEWQQRKQGYTVYNFTVADDHTYFVGTAGGGAWVHNTCPTLDQQALMDLAKEQSRLPIRNPANPYVTPEEADTLWQWGNEYGVNVQFHTGGWTPIEGGSEVPHINVGKIHVPTPPGWTPS